MYLKHDNSDLIEIQNLYYELNRLPVSRKMLEKLKASLIKDIEPVPVLVPPLPPTTPEIYDPWEMYLDYRYLPGSHYPEIVSAGPDKNFYTEDDISSRDK